MSSPLVVKIGDDRLTAEIVRRFYLPGMDAYTHAITGQIMREMPDEGPIPYKLKDIFYRIAQKYKSDKIIVCGNSYGGDIILLLPASYGIEIDGILIVRESNKWYVYDKGEMFKYVDDEIIKNYKWLVGISSFSVPDCFTCDIRGKYFISNKVFDIQDSNDLVYKDQFLIRFNPDAVAGSNYTIIQPHIVEDVAEVKYFTCSDLPSYRLDNNLTLVTYNSLCYIAECDNLGGAIFKVYGTDGECSNEDDILDSCFFIGETKYINDVEAMEVYSNDFYYYVEPSAVYTREGRKFKNHYVERITRESVINYKDNIYVLTELGLIYEVSPGSGKITKPAKVDTID